MFHVKQMKELEPVITRNGICYDFRISPYRAEVDGKVFVFSSQMHKDKFARKLKENRDSINNSLTKRFKISVDVSGLADVILYRNIETRGFLIITREGCEICQNSHQKFVGGKVILTNSNEQ